MAFVGIRYFICRVIARAALPLAAIVALAAFAPPASASSGGAFGAGSPESAAKAQRGTGADCKDPAAVCIPEGNYTITATNSNPAACRFAVTIKWGDGSTDSFTIGPTRETTHHYARPGLYTISVTGVVSAVLQPGATCTGGSGTFRVEVPGAGKADQALTKTVELAADFRKDVKRLRKAKRKKRNRRLQKKAVKEVVRDGRQAKQLKQDYRELGVPKNGDILVPCPVAKPRRVERGCTGGVVEKAEDLWGFLNSLEKLTNYPKYARKRADQWYEKSPEGRHTLDRLAWLNSYTDGRTPQPGDYAKLTDKQKNDIAIQAQVYDGAIGRVLRDAQKAAKAGSDLAF